MKTVPTPKSITDFDSLPDSALVPVSTVATVTSRGISTIWREAQSDPRLKAIKIGGSTRFRVGGIRQYMSGEVKPSRSES